MLKVVCVKRGTKYGPEFVNILYDMVKRNLFPTLDGEFICFTDDASELHAEIKIRGLPPDVNGWWCKLYLFSKGLFNEGDRIVYFDLDTVLLNPLEPMCNYAGEFAICRDFMRVDGWNSSIMLWRAGFGSHIWSEWLSQGMPDIPGGDQEWIQRSVEGADLIQDLWPGSVASYKMDCALGYPKKGTVAVCFHGEPKPDNCGVDWVSAIWRIGGGTATHLTDMVCNVGEDAVFSNIRSACMRELPWLQMAPEHDGHAVIVGGGPSLDGQLDEIRWRKSLGQTIFSLNGTHDYLRAKGIVSDYHAILDARQHNARFVSRASSATRLLASQCHPSVFDSAGRNVTVWHSNIEGLNNAIPADRRQEVEVFIGGGGTVGLNTMSIAYVLGYRLLHLYGFDSSYAENEGHAYDQPENDADRAVDAICEGRTFKAAPWMIAQANEFQTVAYDLASNGCTITVHGDGLLPWIAKQQQFSNSPDTNAVEIDGLWWPSRDQLARPYIMNSLGDIDRMLAFTEGRKVAVQAGGNVGVWPRELSKHFEKVYTFEPDALNFECLQKNAPGVIASQTALGDTTSRAALSRDPSNCGAHYIEAGDEFEVVRLDDQSIDACDLLQLDVEGHELQALRGAEGTIAKHRPTIVLEIKGHGERYGYGDDDLTAWLAERGYSEKARFGRDVLFTAR